MIYEVIPVKTGMTGNGTAGGSTSFVDSRLRGGMTDLVLLQYPHMVSICLIN